MATNSAINKSSKSTKRGGELRCPNHTTTQERACTNSQSEIRVGVPALRKLAQWYQKYRVSRQGGVACVVDQSTPADQVKSTDQANEVSPPQPSLRDSTGSSVRSTRAAGPVVECVAREQTSATETSRHSGNSVSVPHQQGGTTR